MEQANRCFFHMERCFFPYNSTRSKKATHVYAACDDFSPNFPPEKGNLYFILSQFFLFRTGSGQLPAFNMTLEILFCELNSPKTERYFSVNDAKLFFWVAQ